MSAPKHTAGPACRGCGEPIIAGQLRRGDNWHAACHSSARSDADDLAAAILGRREAPRLSRMPRIKGLTPTQVLILTVAARTASGSVGFGAGDRGGSRVARYDDMGRPWIIAYSTPQYFLKARGLLVQTNEPHVYRITDAGRAALAPDDYEHCVCGELSHVGEAACIHCGEPKEWDAK